MTEHQTPKPEDARETAADTQKKRGGKFMKRVVLNLCGAILIMAIGLGALTYWTNDTFGDAGPLAEDTVLVIKAGSGLSQIAQDLEQAGVIQNAMIFIVKMRLSGRHTQLKAGEYNFPAGISQADVARMLIEHDVVSRRVTIPEGLTSREIIAILENVDGLTGDIAAVPPEGSLLPETYAFQLGESRVSIIQRMRDSMTQAIAELWAERHTNLPYNTVAEAVTLASIIEKETGVGAERDKVSGVFVNRLRRGMRLQSDPTVIFALTEGKQPLGRALTRQDWKYDHPYNTYRISGLPPGPITNPGRESLAAAMQPMTTTALYFVADGTGGHAFADTLADHNRNVANWRRIRDGQ